MNNDFSPMGLEAIAQRIGNACGHDFDAQTITVQRPDYCAITMSEDESPLRTYAFVLNFFNQDGDYADFIAFGITLHPDAADSVDDGKVLPLLDMLYSLVDRPEFVDLTWDLAATDGMSRPMITEVLPMLQWGFHCQPVSDPVEMHCAVADFLPQLQSFLETLRQELGNCNAKVWEYQNIDF